MATVSQSQADSSLEPWRTERRWLGLGFCWGALLLAIFAIWLGARELETPVLNMFLGSGPP